MLRTCAIELHLFGLIGTASHPKIQIIGFFFENRPHWHREVRLLTVAWRGLPALQL
jgi:hypothetical protein